MEVKGNDAADRLLPFTCLLFLFFNSNVFFFFFCLLFGIFEEPSRTGFLSPSHVTNNSFVPLKSCEMYEYRGFSVTDKADAF